MFCIHKNDLKLFLSVTISENKLQTNKDTYDLFSGLENANLPKPEKNQEIFTKITIFAHLNAAKLVCTLGKLQFTKLAVAHRIETLPC